MSAGAKHTRAAGAKSGPEKNCGKHRKELRRVAEVVASVAHKTWGGTRLKLDRELSYRMGADSDRTAQYVLAGDHNPSGEHLFNLINSDIGVALVLAMTAKSTDPAWRRFRKIAELADMRRAQVEIQRRLAALEVEASE